MELWLRRRPSQNEATIGELYILDKGAALLECYTLEDEIREVEGEPVEKWKVPGKTAIPAGKYRIVITRSNRFSRRAGHDVLTPQLLDVPGFTGIRIHCGNRAEDTEGCLLVGTTPAADGSAVWASRAAYDKLFPKIEKALHMGELVWIRIDNPGG